MISVRVSVSSPMNSFDSVKADAICGVFVNVRMISCVISRVLMDCIEAVVIANNSLPRVDVSWGRMISRSVDGISFPKIKMVEVCDVPVRVLSISFPSSISELGFSD